MSHPGRCLRLSTADTLSSVFVNVGQFDEPIDLSIDFFQSRVLDYNVFNFPTLYINLEKIGFINKLANWV